MTHCYFSESSKDIQLLENGKKFKATCLSTPGDYYESTFDLHHYLTNDDGRVGFGPVDKLPCPGGCGAYTDSCSGITLSGTILKGSAKKGDGSVCSFALDLDKNIRNTEGRLTWVLDPSEELDHPDNDVGGFGSYPTECKSDSSRVKRNADITPPSTKDKKDIQNLIRLWDMDMMDPGLGQTTLVTFPRNPPSGQYRPYRDGWRIDQQENGSFSRVVNGVTYQYYSVAVQNGSPVYANALVPVNYHVGRTRIRNALNRSMEEGRVVTIDPPNQNVDRRQLPSQMSAEARDAYVRSIIWTTIVIGVSIMLL